MRIVGIFGGTFDPVHRGHLEVTRHLYDTLGLDHVRYVLSARPPHRAPPAASVSHRAQMLSLALADQPGFTEDGREQQRRGPSYMLWTLRSLRAELGRQPMALILGADAFLGMNAWFCWQQILALSHLLVLPRTGSPVSALTPSWYRDPFSADAGELERTCAGRVLICNTPHIDVSASAIREKIAAQGDASADLPAAVLSYIRQHGLYRCAAQSRQKHAV